MLLIHALTGFILKTYQCHTMNQKVETKVIPVKRFNIDNVW